MGFKIVSHFMVWATTEIEHEQIILGITDLGMLYNPEIIDKEIYHNQCPPQLLKTLSIHKTGPDL